MKIAQINMLSYGSTGKIMLQIADCAVAHGHTAKTFATTPFNKKGKVSVESQKNHYIFGSFNENRIHCYLGIITGGNGLFSYAGTKELIKQLKRFNPDIIHLHNLHAFCINLPMLFGYIKKSRAKVIWTLHDCWSFTGHCPHFAMAKCEKWKTGCHNCSQISGYPESLVDNSKAMYSLKKSWFTGIENMTVVTPSQWLADLVSQSFLKDYPVKVINNGIDLSIFKPTKGSFREKYSISDNKKILLGVALGWGKRKGLDVFKSLAERLDDNYQIVLVGTDDVTDRELPDSIISVHRTQNQQELAEIYSEADLFINPTREDTFPSVNIEALACGTPVLTFKTGGSPEIMDFSCGSVVACDDIDAMESEIIRICNKEPYSSDNCITRAKLFDMNDRFKEYVKLYEDCAYIT